MISGITGTALGGVSLLVTGSLAIAGALSPLWPVLCLVVVLFSLVIARSGSNMIAYDNFEVWKGLREEALSDTMQLGQLIEKHGSLENLARFSLLVDDTERQAKWKLWKESPEQRGPQAPTIPSFDLLFERGFISHEEHTARESCSKKERKARDQGEWTQVLQAREELYTTIGLKQSPEARAEFRNSIQALSCEGALQKYSSDGGLWKIADCDNPLITSEEYRLLRDFQTRFNLMAFVGDKVRARRAIEVEFQKHFKAPLPEDAPQVAPSAAPGGPVPNAPDASDVA